MSGSQTFRDVSAVQRTDEAALCAPPLVPAFPIFHWSPISRRKQIERYGFRVQMRSVDGVWRPPYTCWARDPQLAWWLSGAIHPEIDAWDLWQTWSDVPSGIGGPDRLSTRQRRVLREGVPHLRARLQAQRLARRHPF